MRTQPCAHPALLPSSLWLMPAARQGAGAGENQLPPGIAFLCWGASAHMECMELADLVGYVWTKG